MGKKGNNSSFSSNKSGKSSSSTKYSQAPHVPSGNKARESEERKLFLRNKIEIKRLASNVTKTKAILQGEGPVKEEKKGTTCDRSSLYL